MQTIKVLTPKKIIHETISRIGNFPNNSIYPLLIYKRVLDLSDVNGNDIQEFLDKNGWSKSWTDGIYDYRHYHSNTHEVLVIIAGACTVEFGGNTNNHFDVQKGDVIIIPAGVSHRNLASSADFKCVGAYPFDIEYDMNYGTAEEYTAAVTRIKQVGIPCSDPIFGKNGPLFDYWR